MASARLHFRPAQTFGKRVQDAFRTERERIGRLLPRAEVLHTGATSVPTALTRGDVDIHVRVSADHFPQARDTLAGVYTSYRPHMWTGAFATFVAPDAPTETGVALTTIGSEHDRRFIVGWDRLTSDPRLLEAYNTLKLQYEDSADVDSYEAAKSVFFSALMQEASIPMARPDRDTSVA